MRIYDLELDDVSAHPKTSGQTGYHRFSALEDPDQTPEALAATPVDEDSSQEALLLEAEVLFMEGARASNADQLELATQKFKEVLKLEPRLAEPRLELAVLALRQQDLDEAEEQAREAIERLELGWQWLDVLSEDQLKAHACTLLGEILLARALSPQSQGMTDEEMRGLWNETSQLFDRAVALDPHNADAKRNQILVRRKRAG